MGFFDWIGYRAKLSGRDTADAGNAAWERREGTRVNQQTALSLAAAWACVRLKSRVVGSLPLSVFTKGGAAGREEADDHWLYGLLHDSPNADQTPYEFWSSVVGCIDLWGNAYAEKTIGALGRTTALTPWQPDKVVVRRNADGEREYRVWDRGQSETLPEDKVFHVRGMTLGGDVGLSAVALGCRSIGSSIEAEISAMSMLSGGLQLSGFMETGSTSLKPEQREDLIAIFNRFMGSSQAGKIMPLEKDFKFSPLRMNPVEAQLLETRGWNVEEVCRWFDTPPIMIGHSSSGATMFGSGVEQTFLAWRTMGLNPLLTSIEQAARKQLLPIGERKAIKPEFNREATLAADSASRAALYSSFGQNGVMTRNEMRAKENLPAMPGGDALTVQSNLVPLDQLGYLGARGDVSTQQPKPKETVK